MEFTKSKIATGIHPPAQEADFSKKVADWEEAYESQGDQEYEAASDIISEYKQHVNDEGYHQRWDLVPFPRLKKIWEDYVKFRFVRDESGLNKIADILTYNVAKIQVNTVLCGHESGGVERYTDTDEEFPEGYFEINDTFFEDERGSWRISDYAMKPLISAAADIRRATNAEDKLQAVDHLLNIVHMRSDLASWFVQGGSGALSQLSQTPPDFKPKKPADKNQYNLPFKGKDKKWGSLKNPLFKKKALDALLETFNDEERATHQQHADPSYTTQNGKLMGKGTEVEEGALDGGIPGSLLASKKYADADKNFIWVMDNEGKVFEKPGTVGGHYAFYGPNSGTGLTFHTMGYDPRGYAEFKGKTKTIVLSLSTSLEPKVFKKGVPPQVVEFYKQRAPKGYTVQKAPRGYEVQVSRTAAGGLSSFLNRVSKIEGVNVYPPGSNPPAHESCMLMPDGRWLCGDDSYYGNDGEDRSVGHPALAEAVGGESELLPFNPVRVAPVEPTLEDATFFKESDDDDGDFEITRTAVTTKSYGAGTPIGGTSNAPATPPPTQPQPQPQQPVTQPTPTTTAPPQQVQPTPSASAPPTTVPPVQPSAAPLEKLLEQTTARVNKTADVSIKETPSFLPPRDDMRRHIDETAMEGVKEPAPQQRQPQPVQPQQRPQQPQQPMSNQEELMRRSLASEKTSGAFYEDDDDDDEITDMGTLYGKPLGATTVKGENVPPLPSKPKRYRTTDFDKWFLKELGIKAASKKAFQIEEGVNQICPNCNSHGVKTLENSEPEDGLVECVDCGCLFSV